MTSLIRYMVLIYKGLDDFLEIIFSAVEYYVYIVAAEPDTPTNKKKKLSHRGQYSEEESTLLVIKIAIL